MPMGIGTIRLRERDRAKPFPRRWSQTRAFNLVVVLLSCYQAVSTSVLYVRRWAIAMHGAQVLQVDHRIGLMAIGAACASLGTLFFEVTGYDWQDTLCAPTGPKLPDYPNGSLHVFTAGEANLSGSLNKTNKHVYDCALAVYVHLVHLRYSGRCFPLFQRRSMGENSVAAATVLPSAVALLTGVPLIAHSFWGYRAKLTYRSVPRGDKLARALILLAIAYVAAMSIEGEAAEVVQVVGHHVTNDMNADWAWKDGWADFLWVL